MTTINNPSLPKERIKVLLLEGIPVFNAPFSNTRSVAELTIAEIIMLYRRTFPRSVGAHEGRWEKSAAGSNEIRGKTLGIVGYGNIGSQFAVLAEAMGLRVIYYDRTDKLRHGNVEPTATLEELLAQSDVVSLHVTQTAETAGMIGVKQIGLMKEGAFLINNSRGNVVDLDAAAAALKEGRLGGVFAKHGVNIAAQHYETDADIGYAVLDADVNVAAAEKVVADIRALDGTIRARRLTGLG